MILTENKKIFTLIFLLMSYIFYSIYIYSFLPKKVNQNNLLTQAGKIVWHKYNCNACHQIYGQGGYIGPDLTNSITRIGPEAIKVYIKYGTIKMPNFKLSNEETDQLINFLKHIDSSGNSDPRTFKISIYGNIQQ